MDSSEKLSVKGANEPISSRNHVLSDEELQRLQNQLLDLRSANYKFEDENAKFNKENAELRNRVKCLEEEVKGSKGIVFRTKRAKDAEALEEEVKGLRLKLATQEEEFRLQQATLMEELNRVVRHSDELEQQSRDPETTSESALLLSDLKAKNSELQKRLASMEEAYKTCSSSFDSSTGQSESERTIELVEETKGRLSSLEARNKELEELVSENAEARQDANKFQKRILDENKTHKEVVSNLKAEISSLNEKFRRKQESYVQLNEEKERLYQNYKKSLDSVTEKKDEEMNRICAEMQQLRHELKTVDELKEARNIWAAEKASMEQEMLGAKATCSQIQDQNEMLQIQLQETHSANDCLSSQLQDTRAEVVRMQERVNSNVEKAEKRKALVDEMALHLDSSKETHKKEQEELMKQRQEQVAHLEQQIADLKVASEMRSALEAEVDSLKEKLSVAEDEIERLKDEMQAVNGELEKERGKCANVMKESEDSVKSLQETWENAKNRIREEHAEELATLTTDREIVMASVERLKQELKDKDDQIKLVEKKHAAIIKDVKRQTQSEKRRADRLQEKLQEAESSRNKSPGAVGAGVACGELSAAGFEEVKVSDVLEATRKSPGDNGSISSWSMLSGNNQSKAVDNESTSSVTILESENQDLIDRLAMLQKEKSELEERVAMLEDSNAFMAEDLVRKSAVIEQFVKEKPVDVIGGSPDRMPAGLKKVLDLMKMDQSAPDIREMNRRLQVMLEEALTRNMQLQRDLENCVTREGSLGREIQA